MNLLQSFNAVYRAGCLMLLQWSWRTAWCRWSPAPWLKQGPREPAYRASLALIVADLMVVVAGPFEVEVESVMVAAGERREVARCRRRVVAIAAVAVVLFVAVVIVLSSQAAPLFPTAWSRGS
jgi:hypothetical protein